LGNQKKIIVKTNTKCYTTVLSHARIIPMSNVLLCANEPILAEGLRRILENVPGLELAGCCPRLEDLREQVEAIQPDILLVDLTADVTFSVLSGLREAVSTSRIVVWVHAISTELALQLMSLGVRGILRRTLPVETLVRCLLRVNEGELWFEKALTDSIMTAHSYSLTRREGQLVALLSQGLKNKEIAYQLSISEGTVKVYMSRLFQKLGVKDRFELALYGLKNLAPGSRVTEAANVTAAKRQTAPLWQPPRSFFVERIPVASQTQTASRVIAQVK
jgi:DNA-binding NarL/FixJ family response regulator